MSDEDLQTRDLYQRLLSRWSWLVLSMILGGMIALGASLLVRPTYEAHAVVGVGIDYARALPMDDETTRYALDRVRGVMLGDETLALVLERSGLGAREPGWTPHDLRHRLRLSEEDTGWDLSVLDGSAVMAAKVANTWASVAAEQLGVAIEHAWRVADLQATWYGAGCSLQPVPGNPLKTAWSCALSPDQAAPESILGELQQELILSQGVLPVISFAPLQSAEVPTDPAYSPRGWLVLAGLFVGLVAGLFAAGGRPRTIEVAADR